MSHPKNSSETAPSSAPEDLKDRTLERFLNMPLPIRWLCIISSASGVALAVTYVFGLYPILDVTYYLLLIAAFLPQSLLLLPATKHERRVSWNSYLPALVVLSLSLLLAFMGRSLVMDSWVPVRYGWQLAVAAVYFVLILEIARRSGGLLFFCLVAFFGLYPFFAYLMPGIFWGPPTSLGRTIAFGIYSNDAMLGVVTRVIAETIIGFLILAALLVATGAAGFFLQLAKALMGASRGGPAKVSVLASGFFGSLSGSIFGNVVSTGSITIPSMKKAGFPGYYAGALEACASTGGMLMPPVMGAVAFIMADFTNTDYSVIVLAALIPSLLYFFALYCQVHCFAVYHDLKPTESSDVPSVRQTLKAGWPFIVVLAFLVWGLLVMRWERLTPFYASGLLLALTFLKKDLRLNFHKGGVILFEIGKLLSQTMGLLLPTSFILGGLLATGVAPHVAASLVQMGGGALLPVLAIGVLTCLIFGMLGMIVTAYLMLALTLAPALEQIGGLNPLAIHLFIAYYATLAAITPPVALAAFLASRISNSGPMLTSLYAARLGVVLYFAPIFFLFEPALIFQGPIHLTAIWFALNVLSVIVISAGAEGAFPGFGKLRFWCRFPLFFCGLLIGFPEWLSTLAGLAVTAGILLAPRWSRMPMSTLPTGLKPGSV